MSENCHAVLCVNDEKNILRSLKRLLRKEDYRLLTASSGEEGLKVMEENNVHIVISDHRNLSDYFSKKVEEKVTKVLTSYSSCSIKEYRLSEATCDIDLIPLSGRFRGKGLILTFFPCGN